MTHRILLKALANMAKVRKRQQQVPHLLKYAFPANDD